jgi:hypothetical protein
VLYEERYGDQYGSARRVLTRFDARRATRLSRTRYDCALGFTEQHCPAGTDYREVAMAATGAGASRSRTSRRAPRRCAASARRASLRRSQWAPSTGCASRVPA